MFDIENCNLVTGYFIFQADGVVKEKLNAHKECIDILSLGASGLQSAIPSASGGQAGVQVRDSPIFKNFS
jgi:hypothetical protein